MVCTCQEGGMLDVADSCARLSLCPGNFAGGNPRRVVYMFRQCHLMMLLCDTQCMLRVACTI
jgi:hypothetical protein